MKVNDKLASQIRAKVEAKVKEKLEARSRGEPASKAERNQRYQAIAGAILGGKK